jgi:hypothetical protein
VPCALRQTKTISLRHLFPVAPHKHFDMPPIEYQILLAASDVEPGERQRERLLGLMARDFEQGRLVDMALREGVAGLLYKNLKKAGVLGYLGHEQIRHLQSAYYLTICFNLALIHDLKEILRRLNQRKIRVVLLQGIGLLQQTYKDIGLRPLTDIDLWVLPGRRDAVDDALAGLGYKKNRLYPNIFKRNATIVDINTHILWADRIKSRQLLIHDIQGQLFDSCRPMDFEGETTHSLSPPDQILYLGLHVIKHYADRLIWLVDLKNLLQDCQASDWQALIQRGLDLGQENMIDYVRFLVAHLFDCSLPYGTDHSASGRPLSCLEKMILRRRLNGRPLPVWSPLLLFTSGKRLSKKATFIFESLFPRAEVLRQVFANNADLKVWQLYLKRALQIVSQAKL